MSLIAAIAALLLLGQDVPRDCQDDNGTDRCAAEDRAEVLRALGLTALEDEKAAGVEVYRILQVDGYGNVMPSIAYERRPGGSPQVVVYAHEGRRLSASVSVEEWADVQQMARFADRSLEPLPDQAGPLSGLCLHSWISTVEITNAADRGVPDGPIRRRTESACGGALTTRFAFDLPTLAIKHFPECALLDAEDFRNDMTRLAFCTGFKGDRLAVASLVNQVGWRMTPDDDADEPLAWARRFGMNAMVRLDWGGDVITASRGVTRNAAADYLAQRQTENPSLRAYIQAYEGVSSTRVETAGRIYGDGPDETRLSAAFEQVWLWDSAGLSWTLESWTVQPFVSAD